jgi:hypothetical protein
METQRLLFENSKQIPEGLYIELMNKLKIDFDNVKTEKTILVINKSIAKHVLSSKRELIEKVITCSIAWEDREDALIRINRMSYWDLKDAIVQESIMRVFPYKKYFAIASRKRNYFQVMLTSCIFMEQAQDLMIYRRAKQSL